MNRYLRSFAIFLLGSISMFAQPDPGSLGPQSQGWYSETVNRDSRTMNCRIYYPALSDGENALVDSTQGPYPIIAFGHGFLMQTGYYISLLKQLSSHGFIVIAPQFSDTQHGELGKDLIACLNHIKNLSRTPGNRFYQLADTSRTGVSGHSMGGGASLLSTIYDTTIIVAAPFAAAETTPTIIGSINNTRSWIYLISAQNDGITPPATTQIPMYNNTPGKKGLLTLKGGNHTKFMDTGIFDWTDPRGYLSRTRQIYLSQKYLTAVMRYLLKGEYYYGTFSFGDSVAADTSVILETTVGVRGDGANLPTGFSVSQNYPNPFNPVSRVEYSLPAPALVTVTVYGIGGEEAGRIFEGYKERGTHGFEINAGKLALSSGVYLYKLTAIVDDGGIISESRKFVVLK